MPPNRQRRPVTALPKTLADIWPVIIGNHAGNGRGKPPDLQHEQSALKMFGYTVGLDGWPHAKRYRFLIDCVKSKVPDIIRKTFGDDYGEPLKIKRMLKLANVIASIAIVLSGTTRSATASRSMTGIATSSS